MIKRLAGYLLVFCSVAWAQPEPVPLRVTRILGISTTTVIDNRNAVTRQNDMHTFCATGSGIWSVKMQYSNTSSSGPWSDFPNTFSTVSDASSACTGLAYGNYSWLRFLVTGTASAVYSGVKQFYIPTEFLSSGTVLASLNGLTGSSQTFSTGTTGTDFGISSSGTAHTFNLPSASAVNRGLLTSADWSTFNGKGDVSTGGSYSNPSWITALAWSKISGAPVAATTNGARVGSNDGLYLEPANPAIGFNAYYDAGWKFGNASPDNYASVITRDASGNLVFSVSSATGAPGATPTFNSMTFSQSTRKLSGVTPGTASGEVVALNGSNQVDLSLIPTCSQAEAEAGTATTCVSTAQRVAQAIAALQVFQAAGAGVTCSSGTCGANYSEVMRWSVSAGTPGGTPTAGSIWNLDTDNGRPYLAIGGTWVRTPTYAEVALASHAHAAADVTSGTLPVARGGTNAASFSGGKCLQSAGDGLSIEEAAAACGTGSGGAAAGEYSGTVNLGAIPDMACLETTFAATGATTSMIVELGLPAAWETGLVANAWISAADTAKLRACNMSGASVDPASATFKVKSLGSLGLLTGSGTINFGSVPDMACLASTLSVTGAVAGDHVTAGWPTALETGLTGSMFVSAADTVAVRLCNFSGAAVDPASATFKAAIVK